MAHSAEMDEARRLGAFDDVIGTVTTSSADSISWVVKSLENKKLSLSVLEALMAPSSREPTKMSEVSARQQNSEIYNANSLNLTAPCALRLQDISGQRIRISLLPLLRLRKHCNDDWLELDEKFGSRPCIEFWIPLAFTLVLLPFVWPALIFRER